MALSTELCKAIQSDFTRSRPSRWRESDVIVTEKQRSDPFKRATSIPIVVGVTGNLW
jgi:hypothetical protein